MQAQSSLVTDYNNTHDVEVLALTIENACESNGTVPLNPDSFNIICSKCQQSDDIKSAVYVPQRQDLRSFLESNFEGRLILMYYEKKKDLNDNMRNHLSQILINRELSFILEKNDTSVHNPLQKLEYACIHNILHLEARIMKQNFLLSNFLIF